MDLLLTALMGSVVGALAGLLPAIGTFAALLIFYPLLLEMSVPQLLAFFVCLSSVSQFTGSVPAILLKIPGESSSLVAIKESINLIKHGHAGDAVVLTAVGSFLAGISAAVFTLLFFGALDSLAVTAFGNTVLTSMLVILILFFCTSNNNKFIVNIGFILLGLALGLVGYNTVFDVHVASFNGNLSTGLPVYPVITGIFVVSELCKSSYSSVQNYPRVANSFKHFDLFSWLRGTVIGYFCGLLPMAGKIIGTNISYSVEQKLSTSSLKKILSAESANNSAIISSLLPLLIFGIPITLGEALLVDIIQYKNFEFNIDTGLSLFTTIIPAIVLANCIGLIAAWPLATRSLCVFKLNSNMLIALIGIVLVVTNFYIGSMSNQQWYYMIVLAVSSLGGYALRHRDTFPIIFAFILHDQIITNIYRFVLLNF